MSAVSIALSFALPLSIIDATSANSCAVPTMYVPFVSSMARAGQKEINIHMNNNIQRLIDHICSTARLSKSPFLL